MVRAMQVEREVLAVLDRCVTEGEALRLPKQLDRNLYVRVNKVLEAAGGKWDRKSGAHVFAGAAADAIEGVILTGEVCRPEDFGQFDSPPAVVARLLELAEIQPGMTVLEPSAGLGNLVLPILQITRRVTVVEQDEARYQHLMTLAYKRGVGEGPSGVWHADFLKWKSPVAYDRVVMNPPFAKQEDLRHVIHAAGFLKAGGRLVAVMSSGVTFRENKLTQQFRTFLEDRGGTIEPLPEGSFKASGTGVNTVIVTFEVGN